MEAQTEDAAISSEVAVDGKRELDDLEDFRLLHLGPPQHGEAADPLSFR